MFLSTLLNGALLVPPFWALQLLLFRVFHIAPWDRLSGLCALWDSLSSFPSLLLTRCTLGLPVWPVIGFPLLGVHPTISIVKLIMIGYHCNCLDGQLNCWAFPHWANWCDSHVSIMLPVIWALAHSSNSFRMVSGRQ